MVGALFNDIIRNMPIRILLLRKLINQEMFGTYSFLLEVDVMKTKMILYRMFFYCHVYLLFIEEPVCYKVRYISHLILAITL